MSSSPLGRLVGFGRTLRRSGLPVGTERILAFCRAAAVLDSPEREDLRLAARITLVSRPRDLEILDRCFDSYFDDEADMSIPSARTDTGPPLEAADRTQDRGEGPAGPRSTGGEDPMESVSIPVVATEIEVARTKDFAELTEEERRSASARIRRLAVLPPVRRSRRLHPAGNGDRFDLRRTLRRSLRTEGEPLRRSWRRRRTHRRSLVLLLDVSGSMSAYSRPLVEFGHAAARAGRRVEVFCFGTRLTRITPALRRPDPQAALAAVGRVVTDWDGGTRIGPSLRELLDGWSARSALRGAVVVLASDGLERGDPRVLARQMERLGRLAHRVLWLNPLKGSPRYEPLARGMTASLPFVDVFLPGHDLASLEALARSLARA